MANEATWPLSIADQLNMDQLNMVKDETGLNCACTPSQTRANSGPPTSMDHDLNRKECSGTGTQKMIGSSGRMIPHSRSSSCTTAISFLGEMPNHISLSIFGGCTPPVPVQYFQFLGPSLKNQLVDSSMLRKIPLKYQNGGRFFFPIVLFMNGKSLTGEAGKTSPSSCSFSHV